MANTISSNGVELTTRTLPQPEAVGAVPHVAAGLTAVDCHFLPLLTTSKLLEPVEVIEAVDGVVIVPDAPKMIEPVEPPIPMIETEASFTGRLNLIVIVPRFEQVTRDVVLLVVEQLLDVVENPVSGVPLAIEGVNIEAVALFAGATVVPLF